MNTNKVAVLDSTGVLKVNGAGCWTISQLFPLNDAKILSKTEEVAKIYKTQHIEWGDVYVIDFAEKEREQLLVMYVYMLLEKFKT